MAYLQMRDGRKLYYVDEGQGQPVVMIHGWKSRADVYESPSQLLRETGKYRCIRYDQCGHLRSEVPRELPDMNTLADDLRQVIELLELEKPILVGWSMGGATVLEYLRKHGCESVEKVVIVDASPRIICDDQWKLGKSDGTYTEAERARDLQEMKENFPLFMRKYNSRTKPGFAALSSEEMDVQIADRLKGYNYDVLISLWSSLSGSDYRDVLPEITCPLAIFHAGKMASCSKEAALYYEQHVQAPVKRVYFENASHALITEVPEEFVQHLRSFFEE